MERKNQKSEKQKLESAKRCPQMSYVLVFYPKKNNQKFNKIITGKQIKAEPKTKLLCEKKK